MLLENKVAIITGGSRGIGYATVEAFLQEGAKVVLCASRQETADKAVAKLKETYADAAVEGCYPNLAEYDSVKAVFDSVARNTERSTFWSIMRECRRVPPFTQYTEETFNKVMDLNVKAVYNCSKAASEHMIAAGSGEILHVDGLART